MPPDHRYQKFAVILILGLLLLLPAGGYALRSQAAPAPPLAAVQPAPAIKPVGQKVAQDGQGRAIYQVQANGIKIGYKLAGAGEPLVLIPGLGNTMEVWPPQLLEGLSRKYRLIILDNRGMGHSTANAAPFTYGLFAGDVISLLDALGVQKTKVLGFSMGSAITQKLLLDYPQRFQKAVIYATTTDGSKVAALAKGKKVDNPIVQRQIEATDQWRTPLDKLPSITQQVLLVVGTADQVVGVSGSKTLAAKIPGAWLAQFKNGGHALMREAPAAFTRTVLDFLEINQTVPQAR
ncbi:MAG: alpha/beta fold hydrolase [Thermodesulfobacteriota bacterium]